jgi:hypothetical protein
MLQGTVELGPVTLPAGTILCVSAIGAVVSEITPGGTVLTATVFLRTDLTPAAGTPPTCTAGQVAILASGTVLPALLIDSLQ